MENKLALCFPHMGAYYIPIQQLLCTIFPQHRVFIAPPITKKTVALGSRYSPDAICAPFKYNLGNYIEALEAGANVLLQTGLGCRYGYYGRVQEQILRDLGYDFQFICFSRGNVNAGALYKTVRELGSPLSLGQLLHAFALAVQSIRMMDAFEYTMRENACFEEIPGSFEKIRETLFRDIGQASSLHELQGIKRKCAQAMKRVKLDIPGRPLRVGIIGELYTLMEPFSNFYIENLLAAHKVSVSRTMSVSFLLFGKHDKQTLKKAGGYLQHTIGANGVDSVAQCKKYAELGYDGVIHMKSFGCTPELNAMPVLASIAKNYQMPIMHLSFDTQSSETGVLTRIEAFCDMIAMRRERADAK